MLITVSKKSFLLIQFFFLCSPRSHAYWKLKSQVFRIIDFCCILLKCLQLRTHSHIRVIIREKSRASIFSLFFVSQRGSLSPHTTPHTLVVAYILAVFTHQIIWWWGALASSPHDALAHITTLLL